VNGLRVNRTKVQAKTVLSHDARNPSSCHPLHHDTQAIPEGTPARTAPFRPHRFIARRNHHERRATDDGRARGA
jgi:hypothetical protein